MTQKEFFQEDNNMIGSSNEDLLICNYCGGFYHGKKALNNHLFYHEDDGNESECQFWQKRIKKQRPSFYA